MKIQVYLKKIKLLLRFNFKHTEIIYTLTYINRNIQNVNQETLN